MFKKKKVSARQEVEDIRNKVHQSVHSKDRMSLKEELDELHAQIHESGKVRMPTRGEIYGHPTKPIGICLKCKKMFPTEQLQRYYINPEECYWLCPKCGFKKRMREKFSSRL